MRDTAVTFRSSSILSRWKTVFEEFTWHDMSVDETDLQCTEQVCRSVCEHKVKCGSEKSAFEYLCRRRAGQEVSRCVGLVSVSASCEAQV